MLVSSSLQLMLNTDNFIGGLVCESCGSVLLIKCWLALSEVEAIVRRFVVGWEPLMDEFNHMTRDSSMELLQSDVCGISFYCHLELAFCSTQ